MKIVELSLIDIYDEMMQFNIHTRKNNVERKRVSLYRTSLQKNCWATEGVRARKWEPRVRMGESGRRGGSKKVIESVRRFESGGR